MIPSRNWFKGQLAGPRKTMAENSTISGRLSVKPPDCFLHYSFQPSFWRNISRAFKRCLMSSISFFGTPKTTSIDGLLLHIPKDSYSTPQRHRTSILEIFRLQLITLQISAVFPCFLNMFKIFPIVRGCSKRFQWHLYATVQPPWLLPKSQCWLVSYKVRPPIASGFISPFTGS